MCFASYLGGETPGRKEFIEAFSVRSLLSLSIKCADQVEQKFLLELEGTPGLKPASPSKLFPPQLFLSTGME